MMVDSRRQRITMVPRADRPQRLQSQLERMPSAMNPPAPDEHAVHRRARPLLARAQHGDEGALGSILALYRPLMLQIANDELDSRLRQKEAASDVVQRTLIEAHQGFARFQSLEPDDFVRWLREILRNNLRDVRRRYGRTKKRQAGRERSLSENQVRALAERVIPATPTNPDSAVIRQEDHERITAALSQLSRADRQVILWRYRDELEFAEIGTRIDRSADAARMLCNRVLKRLGKLLEDDGP